MEEPVKVNNSKEASMMKTNQNLQMGRKKKPQYCIKEKSINHCDDGGVILAIKLFSTLNVKTSKKKPNNPQGISNKQVICFVVDKSRYTHQLNSSPNVLFFLCEFKMS